MAASKAIPPRKEPITVLVRRPNAAVSRGSKLAKRLPLIGVGVIVALLLGLALGYRAAEALLVLPAPELPDGKLTERVNGGIYALELAMPQGQARWMLEFDAEIVTHDGPKNPLELRDALEKLVIAASSLPMVQTSTDPDVAMRKAILAMAAQSYPWLVDIFMRRSDIRAPENKLKAMGDAMRNGR